MSERVVAIAMPQCDAAMGGGMAVELHVEDGKHLAKGQEARDPKSPDIAPAGKTRCPGILGRRATPLGTVPAVGGPIELVAGPGVSDRPSCATFPSRLANADRMVHAKSFGKAGCVVFASCHACS